MSYASGNERKAYLLVDDSVVKVKLTALDVVERLSE